MPERISVRLNRGVQIDPEDEEQDGGYIYPPRRNTYLGPIATTEKISGTINIPRVEGHPWRDEWQGMRYEIIGPDYVEPPPPATSDGDRLKQAIEAAIAAGNTVTLSFAEYGITVPNGWKLTVEAPQPEPLPDLMDRVKQALNDIGLTVVDPANPQVQIELPMTVLYYLGHERPTGARMQQRIRVDVLAEFALNVDAEAEIAGLASIVVDALEAMPNARLQSLEAGDYALPSDPNAIVIGFEAVVIEA